MNHILAISIGPVQEFIAAARKTRDLWFGSYMLSEVSRAVAKAVKDTGAELVFPPDTDISSIANKIVAVVRNGDPDKIAADAKMQALKELEKHKDATIKHLQDKRVPDATLNAFKSKKLEHFLEYYAAWWPFDSESDYEKARIQADRLLAGRKALRNFMPADGIPGVPKSSLDPGRESVIGDLDDTHLKKLLIKKSEYLDAISLIKRLAKPKRFVSVSRVAADPFIRRLEADAPDLLDNLSASAAKLKDTPAVETFSSKDFRHYAAFPYDTMLFYSDGTREKNDIDEAREREIDVFVNLVKEKDEIPAPSPYFAVLVGDGDHMGALINGLKAINDHRELSRKLAGFAAQAETIIAEHYGAMVYSGGDDVLAFLPLDTALTCADSLRQAYANELASFKTPDGKQPTFSCGISIAHCGEHLQHLLNWGRWAERAAKKYPGKNALAVHLHTRTAGAELVESVSSWNDDPVNKRWNQWIRMLAADRIPDGAAYELRTLAREFKTVTEDQILLKEVRRIIERKKSDHGASDMAEEDIETVLAVITEPQKTLDKLVNELIISRRLADVCELAPAPGKGGS